MTICQNFYGESLLVFDALNSAPNRSRLRWRAGLLAGLFTTWTLNATESVSGAIQEAQALIDI